MAKYSVSLGVRIWTNWEVEVNAKNEREAQIKAEEDWESLDPEGEYTEPDYDDAELMGDDAVHIEKLEK